MTLDPQVVFSLVISRRINVVLYSCYKWFLIKTNHAVSGIINIFILLLIEVDEGTSILCNFIAYIFICNWLLAGLFS